MKTKKRNKRRKVSNNSLTNNNGNFIKNLSEEVLTDTQISLLTKGLKFIPTATVKKNKIKSQLLQGYKAVARRMRLKYIFHGQNKSIHPFYVKSNWEPPVQPSVTLEHYHGRGQTSNCGDKNKQTKTQLVTQRTKSTERFETKQRSKFKKADKGTTLVVMNKNDKIQEGQVQMNDINNYKPLDQPIVKETYTKVSRLLKNGCLKHHIHREYLNYIPSLKSTNLLL